MAQLKSLSDTIEKLKVSPDSALPHPKGLLRSRFPGGAFAHSLPQTLLEARGPRPVLDATPVAREVEGKAGFLLWELTVLV